MQLKNKEKSINIAKTIEPLFGYIKELFQAAKLMMKGFKNVKSYLSITAWLYQALIYYNFLYKKPLRRLKYLLHLTIFNEFINL